MLGYSALTGDLATFAARNARRYTFYSVPGGAATLTGLMSLVDAEETDGPEFEWHERRFTEKSCETTDFSDGVTGPWQNAGGVGGATIAFAAGATAKLKVTSTETLANWRVGERIKVIRQKNSGAAYVDVYARITAIETASTTVGTFTVVIQDAVTVDNDAANSGNLVLSLGTPHAEGSLLPGSQTPLFPITPINFTQIFRTVCGFTATQLRQPLFYDAAGSYRNDMRDAAVRHLVEIENAVLFGQKAKSTLTDDDGSPSVVRTMGGIKWFLEQYEAAGGGTAGYRPGGAALTANTDDQKRIIQGPTTGIMPYATWTLLEERIFRTCMSSNNEKLVIGGSAACAAIINYYRDSNNITINRGFSEEHKLSFSLTSIATDYGILHVKSHPRFNDRGVLRSCCYILDMPNLKFRPMRGRDTHKQEHVELPGFDGRKDAYLTEAGLEVLYPESHMWIESMSSIATS